MESKRGGNQRRGREWLERRTQVRGDVAVWNMLAVSVQPVALAQIPLA
jgi:hypothetical protein